MIKQFLKRIGTLFLAAALAASLAAPAAAADVPLASATELTDFTLTLPEDLVLTLGTNGSMTAAVSPIPDAARPNPIMWNWSCSTPSVVAIDVPYANSDSVTLRPVSAGTASITVTATMEIKGQRVQREATSQITVQHTPATGVTVMPSALMLDSREYQTLIASVSPSTADSTNIVWESDHPEVAQVSPQTGSTVTVTGASAGRTTITATSGGTAKGVCTVEVKGVALSDHALTIPAGSSKTLGATPYGEIGTLVEWSSGNDSVAFVSAGGVVTAQSVGKTVITATVGGYSANCEVTVSENTANTITDSVDAGQSFSFSDIRSELSDRCQSTLGEALSYVTNLMVSTDQGTLYYGYVSPDDTGFGVGSTERYYYRESVAGERSLSDVTFVPKAGFNGTATIHYAGYSTGNKLFTGSIRLDVEGGSDVSYTTTNQSPLQFQTADFSAVCRERTGRDISYVTFEQPSSNRGTLYYDYTGQDQYADKVSSATQYNRTHSPYLDRVFFVAEPGYKGSVRVKYHCVDTAGTAFDGEVSITVTGDSHTGHGKVSYSTEEGQRVTFQASDFNRACRDENGVSLDYIRFDLPESGRGTLYYNYRSGGSSEKVSSSTRYYRSGNPSISDISFAPKSGYTGTVSIDFYGYDIDGDSFRGQVSIRVSDQETRGNLSYSTRAGRPVTFSASDFNEACQDSNREQLDYVRFELPPSGRGTLYDDYDDRGHNNSVSESTKYYYRKSPSISDVTFVPRSGYSGSVEIDFSGYDISGDRFSGTVKIDVADTEDLKIRYSVSSGDAVTFQASDFNRVCRAITDHSLDYVRFDLPSSRAGILYYDYNKSRETYHSKVSTSTSYYYSGSSRRLDDVTFVPVRGYSGTVEIPFSGWSSSGERFTGTVEIRVTSPTASATRYIGSSTPIRIQLSDLRAACSALTGRELSYIQFNTLPGSSAGRLYSNYTSPAKPGISVTSGSNYYYNAAPGLDQIDFVPKAGFQGRVVIPYTGFDVTGTQFSGNIEFSISDSYCVDRFVDMGSYAWAKPSVEFLFQAGIANGFTKTQFGPAQNIRRCDFVLMLCRAFQFQSSSKTSFPDVPPESYYAGAAAAAKDLGITQGNQGLFMPNKALTRQEAMVMIKRALIAAGRSVSAGNLSVLKSYGDYSQISDYAKDAVATLVQMGVVRGNQANQLNPRATISRAEMAVILHRVLTL